MSYRAYTSLAIISIIFGIACIPLGIWQLNRLEERRETNRVVQAALAVAPSELDPSQTPPAEYTRVTVTGEFVVDENILLGIRSRNGFPGHHLAAPFMIDGSDQVIFVDAGWVSNEERDSVSRAAMLPTGPQTVAGFVLYDQPLPAFLRAPESAERRDQWQTIDAELLSKQTQLNVLPYYIEWEFERAGDAPSNYPIYQTSIELDDGPHLGYAIQWFMFASIGFIGAFVLFRRRANL